MCASASADRSCRGCQGALTLTQPGWSATWRLPAAPGGQRETPAPRSVGFADIQSDDPDRATSAGANGSGVCHSGGAKPTGVAIITPSAPPEPDRASAASRRDHVARQRRDADREPDPAKDPTTSSGLARRYQASNNATDASYQRWLL